MALCRITFGWLYCVCKGVLYPKIPWLRHKRIDRSSISLQVEKKKHNKKKRTKRVSQPIVLCQIVIPLPSVPHVQLLALFSAFGLNAKKKLLQNNLYSDGSFVIFYLYWAAPCSLFHGNRI